jgi:HEAT repeat protein
MAAESLAELGERTSLPRLVELLQHDDPGVRVSAAAAVGRLATPEDSEAVQGLVAAMDDLIPGVRQVAAQALGRVGSPAAAAPLAARLRRKDEYLLVRRAAAWSLGKLGPDATAIEALTMALTDRDGQVRQIAAQGLGNIGHADVIAALRPLTQDTSDTGRGTVAAAAIQAIEEIEARRAALQPPTPEVPIDHGETSLDERKRRLGLAAPEPEPVPAAESAPTASTEPVVTAPEASTEPAVTAPEAPAGQTTATPAASTSAAATPRKARKPRKSKRPAPNVASNEE